MGWPYLFALLVVLLSMSHSYANVGEVTYDGRSLIINGQRKLLFSGSIHYPRSTPEMWPDLIGKAKEGGLDVIQTYVFWNIHEPQPGQYDFSGRYDLVRFIKEIQAQGLYACLRIGPFIQAEWNYGGFPFWLHDVPGISYRTDNEPFKFYMQNFTMKIVNLMISEGLFASQGGPIILSQIENEYGNIEAAFGPEGPSYVRWAAKMAVELETGVPWVMCKQKDAPDPVINTCNGMKCGETFEGPNSPTKPSLWTEDWTSFYQVFGDEPYIRSAEHIAYHVALFIIAKKGSYINYYMYHGGTNFGRTSAAYMITGYYDQAPLDEYGLKFEPKWGHLKELHAAVKLCTIPLLSGNLTVSSLGKRQQAFVFQEANGACAAFLVNNDTNTATVFFQDTSYLLLPMSISILPDCKNVIFSTAKVNTGYTERTAISVKEFNKMDEWEEYKDEIANYDDTSLKSNVILEQTNTTKDKSDYLWYSLSYQSNSTCTNPVLHTTSLAHVAHVFVNDKYIGGSHGNHKMREAFTLDYPLDLNEGCNNISILSAIVGLPDSGAHLERRYMGLRRVEIQCDQDDYNLTNYEWGYEVGLKGEKLQIYEEEETGSIEWCKISNCTNQPLTWYKTRFDAPLGNEPVALNLSTMGKGEVWVNGQSIGRYWLSFKTLIGQPSQTLYHVPRSFLKPCQNLLVLFEEGGGNPLGISLNIIQTKTLHDSIS